MPTRNIYLALSNKFRDREIHLKNLLIVVGVGGFASIVILSQAFDPKIIVSVGVKIWFSLAILLAIVYMSVVWFNPDRDKNDFTVWESLYVLLLDVWLLMIVWAWFFLK